MIQISKKFQSYQILIEVLMDFNTLLSKATWKDFKANKKISERLEISIF